MRLNTPGPRHARRWGGLLVALSVASAVVPAAAAQAVKAKPPAPTPTDTKPVARYVPRDGLLLYVESQGLDAHADAWQKTAAYKMLNDTPLGAMFEAMAAQLVDKGLALVPGAKVNGADVVALVEMVARRGFVYAEVADDKGNAVGHSVLVLRAAAAREHKAAFGRLIGTMKGSGPKVQVVKKGSRTVVVVPEGATSWAWWVEGTDVVINLKAPEDADLVIDVLDGKRPGAVDHPIRAELARDDSGFVPVVAAFLDPTAADKAPTNGALFQTIKGYCTRVDFRWGFQDDALMNVARVKAARPRQGVLAVFDQPSFDKAKLPPLPEGMETFVAVSADPAAVLDAALGATPKGGPLAGAAGWLDELKSKSRVDLKKDVLAYLGPKMAVYMLPPAASARATGDAGATAAAKAGGAPPPALAGLPPIPGLSGLNLMGPLGGAQGLPRGVLIAEVNDPVAFGKGLDNLMVALNKQLREQATEEAEKAAEAAKAARPPGGPGNPQDAGRRPRRGEPVAAPEFKLMPGKPTEKIYQLQIPVGSTRKLPQGFRPTVRLNGKMVALATSADTARTALEIKAGDWTVPTDLAAAFDQLPKELIFLGVSDPRKTAPDLLASLPGTLQTAANTALALTQANAAAAGAAGARAPGAPGAPGGPRAPGGNSSYPGAAGSSSYPGAAGGSSYPGAGGAPSGPGAPGGSSYPGASGPPPGMMMPGMMPGGPRSGPGAGAPAGNPLASMLQFNIEPDKLPKADDLKAKMFPSAVAVTSDAQEIRIVVREAFPDVAGALVGVVGGVAGASGMLSGGKPVIPGMPGTAAAGAAPRAPGVPRAAPAASSPPNSSSATPRVPGRSGGAVRD